jgi:hypothetical protein
VTKTPLVPLYERGRWVKGWSDALSLFKREIERVFEVN